jgi:hypothetical protein
MMPYHTCDGRRCGIAGWVESLGCCCCEIKPAVFGTRAAVRSFSATWKAEQVILAWPSASSVQVAFRRGLFGDVMKDFSGAAFAPEVVDAMTSALDGSIAMLPDPVTSTQVNQLAESILRTAREGERDPTILQRMALLELQITPRG